MRFDTDEKRWDAIVSGAPAADGEFWYGVRSTGIVCKPTCPSRTPLRKNVNFFGSVNAALELGFRRCKRCNP